CRIGFDIWASGSLIRRISDVSPNWIELFPLSHPERRAARISTKYKPTGEEVMRNAPSAKGGARVRRRSGVAVLFVVPKLEEMAVDYGTTEALDATRPISSKQQPSRL